MRDKEVNSGLTLWFKQGTRPMSLQSLQHVCQELYYYLLLLLLSLSSSVVAVVAREVFVRLLALPLRMKTRLHTE